VPDTPPGRLTRPISRAAARIKGRRLGRRLLGLYAGLVLFGVSIAMMIRGRLGLDSWDVLHQGLARQTGLPFGWIVIGVGAVVLLLGIPLRQRPGFGTVSNVIVVGLSVDAALAALPHPRQLIVRTLFLLKAAAGEAGSSPWLSVRSRCGSSCSASPQPGCADEGPFQRTASQQESGHYVQAYAGRSIV
jgi:hypothetical protein